MSNYNTANKLIRDIKAFRAYLDNLKPDSKYIDHDKVKAKIHETIRDITFYVHEVELFTDDNKVRQLKITRILNDMTNALKTMNHASQMKTLSYILSEDCIDEINNISLYYFNSTIDNYYYGYDTNYKLDIDFLIKLRSSIANNNALNIFYMNCFSGINVDGFAIPDKDITYGYYNSDSRAAKEKLNRFIKGTLKGSYISNNFFDIVFLNPTISFREDYDALGRIMENEERISIRNSLKYVRKNGVMIFSIPVTRMTNSLALHLSKVLSENTQIIRQNAISETVVIIGQKDITQKAKESLYNKLKYLDFYEDTISIEELEQNIYSIPTEVLQLEYFRGSQLDISDIMEAVNPSLIDNLVDSQLKPLVVKDQSPLLPFNMGQIGLVLTSGCLDGVIKEVDGVYHVIKGMTTKLTTCSEEEEEDKVKSVETITNQVKINIFTADGKFIELG